MNRSHPEFDMRMELLCLLPPEGARPSDLVSDLDVPHSVLSVLVKQCKEDFGVVVTKANIKRGIRHKTVWRLGLQGRDKARHLADSYWAVVYGRGAS